MKSTVKYLLLFFVSLFIPSSSLFAQGASDAVTGIATVGSLITIFTSSVVKATGTLFMSLAVVAFIYGIVEYIWGMRDAKPDKISNGQKFMVWSLVALFVMFSVYGIVKFGQDILFQGKDMSRITIPEINLQGSNSSNNQAYNGGQVSQVSSPSRQVLGGQGYMPSLGGTSYSAPPSGGQVSSAQGSSGATTVGTGRARASLTLNYASGPRSGSNTATAPSQQTMLTDSKLYAKSLVASCLTQGGDVVGCIEGNGAVATTKQAGAVSTSKTGIKYGMSCPLGSTPDPCEAKTSCTNVASRGVCLRPDEVFIVNGVVVNF